MRWSVAIGEFKGIKVYIHWTFLLLLFYIGFANYRQTGSTDQLLLSLAYIAALFGCVVLHEFGHALTAKRFGIKTRDITLFPIGGMARMEKMPDSPKEELLVAVAGPMVNVVIAGALFAYMHFSSTASAIGFPKGPMTAEMFIPTLFLVNVIMAVFNLIPAFPMDGGRVFRALLAMKLERTRATQIAANVGQVLAIGFVMLGLFYNIWLVFIGIFIYLGAGAEASQEYVKRDLSAQRVGHLLMTKFTLLRAEDQLSMAVRAQLDDRGGPGVTSAARVQSIRHVRPVTGKLPSLWLRECSFQPISKCGATAEIRMYPSSIQSPVYWRDKFVQAQCCLQGAKRWHRLCRSIQD